MEKRPGTTTVYHAAEAPVSWPSGMWQVVRTRLPRDPSEHEQVLEYVEYRDRGQALAAFDRWRADPAVAAGAHRIKVVELEP